jgi:hypothetical protein
MTLTQALERIVGQRVMKPLQIEWKMDPPDRRQVFEKEKIGENKKSERDGFPGVQEPMLLHLPSRKPSRMTPDA